MKESLRKSGIDIIGDVPWGTHFCQFYQTKEELVEILVPYFKSGLENNELCVWIISKPLEVREAKEALRRVIPDFDVYLEKGQIEIIPCTHEHINEGVFGSEKVIKGRVKKSDPFLAGGYDGLRTAGDTPWSKKGELDDFVDYESEVDANIGKYQTISLFPYFLDMCSTVDILKIAFNHQFALIKKEGKWERIESSSRKRTEEALRRSEQHFRPENMLSLTLPSRQMAEPELADIVDARAIRSLMDDFYNFARITMALVDLKGNVLVNVGWQDICTRFHRVHPETCKHCIESDTKLSAGVAPGEFKLYKCKNNMWDVATPIIVDGRHVGNIFSGQFFFEEETPDYEIFRSQARKYGFNEEEYIAALEKVPHLSRETVGTCMAFFMKLAHMISQLGYSNIKMAQSLAERDALLDAVRESEERFRSVLEHSLDAAYRRNLQTDSYDYMSPVIKQITGFSAREMSTMSINEVLGRIHPDDLSLVSAELARALDAGRGTVEYRFRCRDGKYRWLADHFTEIKDQNSRPLFRGGIVRDITEHKQVEEALIRNENKFRRLAENSPDIITRFDRQKRHIYANPAVVEPYGRSPEEIIGKTHAELGMNPEEVQFLEEHHDNVFSTGKPETVEFQHTSPQEKKYYFNTLIVPEFAGGEVTSVLVISRDITYAKEAEARLKEAHENLEKLVEERTIQLEKAYESLKESEKGLAEAQKMAHIGNWDWDIATDKAYWSDELYRIYGCNPQESGATYDELFNYVHPDDRDYVANAIKALLKGKPYGGIDYRMILANGKERIVHAKGEVVFDEKNVPIRIKGITQDITERKKSEEKIQILANIVKSSNDAIGTISLDGIITSWNEEAERVYGYSAEEIIGKHTSFVAPPHLDTETKKLSELIKQGKKIHHYETSRLRKDGKIIHVSITLSPVFDSCGKLTAISFISRDITERKRVEEKLRESEEKYRNIVETANEGIFITDAETIVTYANKKMTDMLGYTLEEVIGRAIWDFVTEEGKAIIKLNQERRRQGINESYELKLICKGGSSLWGLISAKSLFGKDGRFMGSISMLTDITKRKEAEEALENIEIARKQEIHHRIKNNLQVISSLLDLQAEKFNNREDIKDSEILEAFRESQDRVISMALIHEELYKGGGFDTLNFSSYIEELAENLFQTYSLGKADISLKMDLEERIFFDMDIAVPLGIIVNELVSNSLKHAFTEGEEGEIRIRLCREKKNNELDKSLFSLTISDNGNGIPENVELKSFESLGLQLVSILVDQLDGKIELKQEQGTKFRITFKVAERP
ncbi:TPA: PAS domain S-box protein [Methanosarcina acetivorans]|nr:PAS domain S-box protein [Methanosarcina acetivorans]HIH94553.1 PAS domain S-box protein [Methanosarcina acetivorans]